jgi:hypothetical protein
MGIEIDLNHAVQRGATADTATASAGSDALTVLQTIWSADGQGSADLDDDCGPTKTCRNMREVTFDGFGEPGEDVAASWRATLAREGKLHAGPGSVRDLVLGPNAD